ncbi:glycosyltransferase family 87 protein [Haloglomus litoreum]|uniref:glycosyltransferase family 87 protein n=1 Tax=Haloglomus litoreum TaxID=3034026 RepID=UPI0023E75BAE|nr:glycosyltransferase family 87 protein [Haloglomus sp. DT116]
MQLLGWLRHLREDDPWTFRLAVTSLALLAVWPLWFGVGGALGVFGFGGVDFKAYYLAGLRVRDGLPLYGTGPVDAVPEPRAVRFLYPPVVAAPFVLLTLLSPLPARVAFLALQFGFLWCSVLVLLRAWGVRPTRGEALAAGWLLAGVQPVVFTLRTGNITGFVAGLLCLSAAVTLGPDADDRPFLGGALAAVAAVPKSYVAPAGAHLLGDRRRLAGAALAGLALAVAGLALFGPATTREYVDVLTAGNAWGAPRPPAALPRHYRPFAWFERFPPWRTLLRVGILLTALSTALAATADERATAFAMGCVTVPLAAPSADTLTLLVAVPGLLVAGLTESRRHGYPAVVLVGALGVQTSVYAVRVLRHYGPTYIPGMPWALVRPFVVLQPGTAGLLAVFGLCVVRVWRGRLQVPDSGA